MSKDCSSLAKRLTGERPAAIAVRRPKRGRSEPGSLIDREPATGRRLASLTGDRRGGTQDLCPLASGLGRLAAQAFRHVRFERFSAALADTHKLVCTHPLQAVLVGVGLGYLLSRIKVR